MTRDQLPSMISFIAHLSVPGAAPVCLLVVAGPLLAPALPITHLLCQKMSRILKSYLKDSIFDQESHLVPSSSFNDPEADWIDRLNAAVLPHVITEAKTTFRLTIAKHKHILHPTPTRGRTCICWPSMWWRMERQAIKTFLFLFDLGVKGWGWRLDSRLVNFVKTNWDCIH